MIKKLHYFLGLACMMCMDFRMPIITRIIAYQRLKTRRDSRFVLILVLFFFIRVHAVAGLKLTTQDGGFLRDFHVCCVFFCRCSVQRELIVVSSAMSMLCKCSWISFALSRLALYILPSSLRFFMDFLSNWIIPWHVVVSIAFGLSVTEWRFSFHELIYECANLQR